MEMCQVVLQTLNIEYKPGPKVKKKLRCWFKDLAGEHLCATKDNMIGNMGLWSNLSKMTSMALTTSMTFIHTRIIDKTRENNKIYGGPQNEVV